MDTSLEKALEFGNYMSTLENQRRLLLEKFTESTVYYTNGGKFTVTISLISYVNLMVQENTLVLLDDNNMPIMINDSEQFLADITKKYNEALIVYHTEYDKLKKSRSVERLVDLD